MTALVRHKFLKSSEVAHAEAMKRFIARAPWSVADWTGIVSDMCRPKMLVGYEERRRTRGSYAPLGAYPCPLVYGLIALEGKTLPLVHASLAQPQLAGSDSAAGRVWLENDNAQRDYAVPISHALPNAGSERAQPVSSWLWRGAGPDYLLAGVGSGWLL